MSFKKTESQQDELISLLCSGYGITQACACLKMRRQTYHEWMLKDPSFRARYEQARTELRQAHKARLESLVVRAFDGLESDLSNKDWRARHSASKLLLDALSAARLSEIEAKLDRLEGVRIIDI